MKNNTDKANGKGVKSSILMDGKVQIKVDGKMIQNLEFHYDVSVQFESIEYLVQNAAAAIAKVANRIAEPTNGAARAGKVKATA